MCEKVHYDRLRNDGALGSHKSDNKNPENNIRSHWGPVSGSNDIRLSYAKLITNTMYI